MNDVFDKQFTAYSIVIRAILANLDPETKAQIQNTIRTYQEQSPEEIKEAYDDAIDIVDSSVN